MSHDVEMRRDARWHGCDLPPRLRHKAKHHAAGLDGGGGMRAPRHPPHRGRGQNKSMAGPPHDRSHARNSENSSVCILSIADMPGHRHGNAEGDRDRAPVLISVTESGTISLTGEGSNARMRRSGRATWQDPQWPVARAAACRWLVRSGQVRKRPEVMARLTSSGAGRHCNARKR